MKGKPDDIMQLEENQHYSLKGYFDENGELNIFELFFKGRGFMILLDTQELVTFLNMIGSFLLNRKQNKFIDSVTKLVGDRELHKA